MAQLKAIILEVTGGNLRNSHIYLQEASGFFPDETIGGKNKESAATNALTVRFDKDYVETDIAGDKMIFRDRKTTREFFKRNHFHEGDLVLIERLAEYEYQVSKASKRGFKIYP